MAASGCDSDLSADFLNFGASNFPFKNLFKKRSGFGAAIFDAIARSSMVFCNSVSADRIVVAASRLLGAAAACVILLPFAAEDRKSYWNGCIKAVMCEESACFTLYCTGDARRSCSWTTTLQQLRTKHARTGLAGARRMQVPW